MKGTVMKKIHFSREAGSVLLATMIFVLAIAAFLVSYLVLVQNSNQNVARAQQWNAALAVAEAGIEEGFANLNMAGMSKSSNAISFSPFSSSLNGGGYSVNSAAVGVITTMNSTGTVSAPISGQPIARIVQVTAQRQALFSKGIISMTSIRMNGNGVGSDSFNSHDTNQSVNGKYVGAYYSGTNGDIASVDGFVNLGNHDIKGDLYLGPNSGMDPKSKGTVLGETYNDWNMQFGNVDIPKTDAAGVDITGLWTPAPGTGSLYTFTNSGYYIVNDAKAGIVVNPGITVTIRVDATDFAPAKLDIQGGITNPATVIMYQMSGSLTLSGNSAGGAAGSRPENFQFFGGTNLTSIAYSGTSDFYGVIYAPQADMSLSGGGSGINFVGSFLVKSFTMNGSYNIHYDTSLVGLYWGLFVAGNWRELNPS